MLDFGQQWFGCSLEPKVSTIIQISYTDKLILQQRLSPARVLFPKEYYSDHQDVQRIADAYVTSLAEWLGADRCDISIEDTWNSTKPAHAPKGFFATFNKVGVNTAQYPPSLSLSTTFRPSSV